MEQLKSILQLKKGGFSYIDGTYVFQNIDFSLNKGEVLCILGPNGTGKSTLIKCLTKILPLDKGQILLDGIDISSLTNEEIARKIGYVPQSHYSAFPYSVQDLIVMGRAPHLGLFSVPSGTDFELAYKAMETVGISHLADRPCTELSGGEQRLVLIARVLTQQPDILLLDEPTSHLDIGNQVRLLRLVNNLAKTGLSIVMSSHFPDHAFISSQKVALMKEGKLIGLGSPDNTVNEQSLKEVYGINVKVKTIEDGINRKVCIPII